MVKSAEERVLDGLIRHMARAEHDPLTPLVDTYFIERSRAKRRLSNYEVPLLDRPRPGGRLSPSKICGCERQAAFVFVGMPGRTVVDPEQEEVFEDGKWRHHKWQARFLDMELVLGPDRFSVLSIEESVEVPELFVAGHLDALVRIGGTKWVVDFKGINSWGFERVFREHRPHEAHVLQLLAYMKARRVPRGMLLYEHKDRNRTKVFPVMFSAKRWAEVEAWCEKVLRRIEDEMLPPKASDCQSGNYLFEKCPFSHLCYGRKSPERIRQRMYRDFDSVEEAWEQGRLKVLAGAAVPDDV